MTLQRLNKKRYKKDMDVGIRELRAGLSRYVEQVKQGEEIVVTEHGKPVARLAPMNGERKRDRLLREGVLIPARNPKGRHPEPIRSAHDVRLSEIVLEMRD